MASPAQPRVGTRLAARFAFVVLLVGCIVLWVGVPVAGVWIASRLTDSSGYHLPLSLAIVVPGMFVFAMGLAWVNDLWLRITGGDVVEVEGVPIRRRGPLETLLPVSGLIAVVAMFVWFFLFAEDPPGRFLG